MKGKLSVIGFEAASGLGSAQATAPVAKWSLCARHEAESRENLNCEQRRKEPRRRQAIESGSVEYYGR